MKEAMQGWRKDNPNNCAKDAPPQDKEHWRASGPETFGDISKGWGWWDIPVGLMRGGFPEEEGGGYGDSGPNDRVALASKLLGLIFSLNLDGFQTFNHGNYSTMGVYITVNNLPPHLRTIIENMLLVIVIPGPNEPTAYEFDQIMEPLIDDLVALGQGIRLNVHDQRQGHPEPELVYGHLGLAVLDHIARMKVCGHAVAEGFKLRENKLRDPLDQLDNKYCWLKAPSAAAREAIRQQTGIIFTVFNCLPGWYGTSSCPIDSMHVFDLGITKFICQNILLKPGLLNPPRRDQPFDEQPASMFDALVAQTQFPSFCQRKPPQFLNMTSSLKAEQWKHIAIILPAALFEAWRDGDLIPNTFIPRGGRNTKAFKFQQSQAAEMLRNRKLVHRERGGLPRDDPKPLSCVAVRNRRLIYATICCYLVGRLGMVRHKVTREGIATSQRLLRRFGSDLARMNYPVTPNAHTALHLEESILQYGLLYGFHTAPFERANRVLININNNGHTGGVVEATMARGWLKRAGCHKLVCEMQGIENLSPDDIATTEMMLRAMRDGPEHERQRGRLNAILAGEENFRSQAILQLPTTSAEVNWTKGDHRPYWESVAAHCSLRIPNAVVYPYGLRPERGVRLTKKNSTRSLRHVHINGARYGTDFHRWAFNSCYAYIDAERHPVLIKRIYQVKLPVEGVDREVVCAVVQRFQPPAHKPGFPWDNWGDQLEIAAWQFAELDEPEVINVTQFSGTFALSDIEMETGHYWLTFAMYPTEPELFENGE
ncbi:pleckstrin homology-like domain, family B, member 1 [Rhizoctonia solani AG-1 IB]|uniref:Pleckstrin homology-like domain, family B, member 1 n=1 Tax=Thanatephorus cucumeris (strain AG1-IB / isolate 7/3/14) TaxID=1108050 RepID=A0A0B7FEI5_THACB|nr:pleckstrin homology-like domain, family B, member 1 [Rhizoctonia solani AG-1 IB]